MERKITINGRTGLFDIPSFLLSENESLKIKIGLTNEFRVGRFRVIVRHGERKKTFTLAKDEPIELTSEWLKQSGENIEFSLVFLNKTATAVLKDDYEIEPLKMETIGGNFSFTAQVQEFMAKQKQQDDCISDLKKELAEVKKIVAAIPAEIEKAKKEAVIEAAGGDPMGA